MHNFPSPIEFLKNHDLRKTPCQMAILESFLDAQTALSHQNIEQLVGDEFDRVTIYRTLTSFEEKGILHKVPDMTGQAKYALCESNCNQHQHKINHVHFKCQKCENVYCLSQIQLPDLNMPEGYKVKEAEFLLSGTCDKCNF